MIYNRNRESRNSSKREESDNNKSVKYTDESNGSDKSSYLNQDGTPNVQEIMKSIRVPPELKYKPKEAQKYQMEQLKIKVS